MKAIALLAHAFLALGEALREFFERRRNRKRQEESREILDDPYPELERRGWLRTDAEEPDLPGAGKDKDGPP